MLSPLDARITYKFIVESTESEFNMLMKIINTNRLKKLRHNIELELVAREIEKMGEINCQREKPNKDEKM